MGNRDFIFPVVLFLVAFFVWTLPIQVSHLPFGEGDAAWHFGIGDFIASHDRSIALLPSYIGYWYYLFNPVLGPNALEYPPSNHVNYAFMELFTGDRFVSVYIYKAVTSFLGVFAVYFLVSRLYGAWPGFLAGFGMAFSSREMLTYLWGQQPTLLSISLVPVALYAFYSYLVSAFEGRAKNIYLYMASFLLISQYLLHIQGVIVSLTLMGVFALLMLVRHRRFPVIALSPVHIAVCAALMAVVAVQFFSIYFGTQLDVGTSGGSPGRLFSWGIDPKLQEGSYPEFYFSFAHNYGSMGIALPRIGDVLPLMPFILLGITFAVLRRKSQDLLLLSWLIGVYITLHLDVFLGTSIPRVARMLVVESQLFFALAAVGAFYLPSIIKLNLDRQLMKLGMSVLLIAAIALTIGVGSYGFMKGSYSELMRISPAEIEASGWMAANLPDDSVIYNLGTISYPKMRFMHVLSQRYMNNKPEGFALANSNITLIPTHYVFDYSDLARFSSDPKASRMISELEGMEKNFSGTRIYDRNNIRIYRVGRNA